MFTSDDWRHAVRLTDRPADAELDAMSFTGDLVPVHEERKAQYAAIRSQFPEGIQSLIDARFKECKDALSSFDQDRPHANSAAYHYVADYVDVLIIYQLEALACASAMTSSSDMRSTDKPV